MLVLSRRREEEIVIDDDTFVKVLEIRGDKVRLGVTAPGHKKVHRKEVWVRIKQEVADAAGAESVGEDDQATAA